MNYQIITDKIALEEFIDWLPNNEKHERFYLSLMVRNKYSKPELDLGNNEVPLHKLIVDKKEILSKIMQMECPVGSYTHKGHIIPQCALAVYINPNPRNLIKANRNIAKKCTDLAFDTKYNGFNPLRVALSEIQKAKDKKNVYDFDFDFEEGQINIEDLIKDISNRVGYSTKKTIIKTRGGLHCMIHLPIKDKMYQNTWHTSMSELGYDNKGDNLLPVVGCIQGGFSPYFILK